MKIIISGTSNIPNPVLDYIEVTLSNEKTVTLDWNESEYDSECYDDSFRVELLDVYSNEASIDVKSLVDLKISSMQVCSETKIRNPMFLIEKIEVCEDEIIVIEIEEPDVEEILFDSNGVTFGMQTKNKMRAYC